MQWYQQSFTQLTNKNLYQILKLRCDVFIVEQSCPYGDLDDKDLHPQAIHLFVQTQDQILGYLRILPPDCGSPNMPSFGRVATHQTARSAGLGHQLVKRANKILDEKWPSLICHISAQAHLKAFYQKHGYRVVGEEYLEDDIPHVGMQRPSKC